MLQIKRDGKDLIVYADQPALERIHVSEKANAFRVPEVGFAVVRLHDLLKFEC